MTTVYVNERSVEGQYCNDFTSRLGTLLSQVRILQEQVLGGVDVLISNSIYTMVICVARNENFSGFLDRNKDLKRLFQAIAQKSKCYDIAINNTDLYTYKDHYVDNSSMSEAYENIAQGGTDVLLLNFGGDLFPEGTLKIEKNLAAFQEVPSASTSKSIGQWLTSAQILKNYQTGDTSKVLDEQTILADNTQFTPTGHYVQGRVVYKRVGHPEYWYVDNAHTGGAVHLEVFQSSDMHFKGTCAIDDITKFKRASKKKRGERTISFD